MIVNLARSATARFLILHAKNEVKKMEEKIIKAMVTDDLNCGVRFFYSDDTELKELTNVQEITLRILKCDPHLIIDTTCTRPKPVN